MLMVSKHGVLEYQLHIKTGKSLDKKELKGGAVVKHQRTFMVFNKVKRLFKVSAMPL